MAAPKLLCDTAGLDRKTWLAYRAHGPDGKIPIALGGSDVSTVFAVNPWKTPLELWREKAGLDVPDDSENVDQKEMGHLLEPIVAHWYAKKTGNTLIVDTGLYQHADYPWALANLDYRFQQPDGKKGILECKTTSYHKQDGWKDDHVPVYYEWQVRFYLAVMDYDFADICCLWGTNPGTDMAIRRIQRDLAIEAEMMERLGEFIASIAANTPPGMEDVEPALALKALAKIYGKSNGALPTIEFGKKYERQLRRIALLQEEIDTLSEEMKRKETEVQAHSVRIAEVMKEHEHGVLEFPTEKLVIDYVTRTSKRPDSQKLKKQYASIYEDVLKVTSSRKLKVTRVAK